MSNPPRHAAVSDAIRTAITDGTYPVGTKLPAVGDLARQHGVSQMTAHAAVTALNLEGILESRSGSGTYVTATPSERGTLQQQVDELRQAVQEMRDRLENLESSRLP